MMSLTIFLRMYYLTPFDSIEIIRISPHIFQIKYLVDDTNGQTVKQYSYWYVDDHLNILYEGTLNKITNKIDWVKCEEITNSSFYNLLSTNNFVTPAPTDPFGNIDDTF